ncbi:MAG: chromate resistance protein [Chloroflexi bacterium]|nr:chromate resistance protein [Chloroflexota bacterium]
MKWVTTDHIHLDRVACPWLIRRFIDSDAEILFVPHATIDSRPDDAIPFAISGVELGPHDDHGTCFEKFLRKYRLDDPALTKMAAVIASGVHHAITQGPERDRVPALEGIGLDALSQGMMLLASDDRDNLDRSMALYDALYAYCKQLALLEQDPTLAKLGFFQRAETMRGVVKGALRR